MPPGDLYIAASFWDGHGNVITAAITVLVAVVTAIVVDRALARRALALAAAVRGGDLSPVADTRLRLLRRLVFVGIIALGVALGLLQFGAVKRAATGVLASSAVLGLVLGFAARQTLANAIA